MCVKLTDSTPLELISRSLNSHNGDDVTTHPQTLLGMLREAIRKDARPTILILDQFEQFFTRNKSKPARKSFIDQMAEWHRSRDSLPVKILISVRDDFADQLSDFQKQMDYALTAHNKLRLEKFEPQEAAQVIAVIAREAKLELDETFVKELSRKRTLRSRNWPTNGSSRRCAGWLSKRFPASRRRNKRWTGASMNWGYRNFILSTDQ